MTVRGERTPGVLAPAVAVFAFVIGVAASWVPSYWYDEAATVYSSRRSFSELLELLRGVDIVHGAYYVGMHVWGQVFGFSEFSMRIPSAVAVGLAAAGVVVLAARLSTPRVALFSGVAFALLPRVLWAAVEARSYALTATAAVWLTVVFLVALHARSRWWWVLYSAMLALSIVLFVYLATLVAVHLLVMLARRRLRASFLPWAIAVATALVVTAVFLKIVLRQATQVGWIPPIDSNFPRVVLDQWFVGASLFGVVVGVIFLAALVVRRTRGIGGGDWRRGPVPVAIPWILVPMAVMVIYSIVRSPIYLDRYFTFSTPAVALLIGVALDRVSRPRWLPVLLIGVLALAALPAYLQQRSAWAKPLQMDFSYANEFAAANVAPGDCVLFGRSAWNPSSQRLIEDVDPSSFAGTRSIGLAKDAAESGQLWDEERPLSELAPELAGCQVIWYFTDRDRSQAETVRLTSNDTWVLPPFDFETSSDYSELRKAGFHVEEQHTIHVSQIVRLVR
ncbi:mannosyltransferase [Rhodococcus sp. Leaf278]|uniref:glycosyltransferase family 39 protein n=1 Tax=Rhodococcus sp. Leaf278 TaxID=1736319 RepID=UPI00070FBE7A|nr:glycosyltransferase family 39 protein [Rhodococcus sp. Leaf278]KQU52409.1 mannosyltransferase [Rhodococcus sp. Leaf278]